MAIRKIREIGDDVLRQECKNVKSMTLRTKILINDMLDTMYDAMGVGLAAPQVGILKKIVVIAAAGKGNRLGAGMPKCLVEINGHAIFEYLLKAFEWADEIRMVVGYKAELVKEKVQAINLSVKFIENREYETTNTLQSNYKNCNRGNQ